MNHEWYHQEKLVFHGIRIVMEISFEAKQQ
jgi:hypothetical protein